MIKENWKLILFVLTAVTGAATTTGYYKAKTEAVEEKKQTITQYNETLIELAILRHKCKFGICTD